jgi:hypothetical protein
MNSSLRNDQSTLPELGDEGMITTEPARHTPHTLNRVGVHKEGLQWEVKVGTPVIFSSTEWVEAEAVAQRLASRWRHAFVAFGW